MFTSWNCLFKKVPWTDEEERRIKAKQKVNIIIQLYKKYKLKNLLKAAKISKSVYYYWASKLSYDKDNEVKEEILIIFTKHFERYGYRRIHAELRRKMVINTKKVRRLMKRMGLIIVKKPKENLLPIMGK
ncbi:IS3 family transposase [Candidatus Mycoplasma pogonae]